MDTRQQMPQIDILPARHFWRRFAAFAVDIIVFQLIILATVHYVSKVYPLDFRLPGWTTTECSGLLPDQLAKQIEAGWPEATSDICEVRQFGGAKQRYLRTGTLSEDDLWLSGKELSIPVDADNNPVTKPMPAYSSLVGGVANTVLIALAFAVFSADGRRTFGKALVFLRVQTAEQEDLDFGTAFKREILKFSPNLLFSVVLFALSLFPAYPTEDFNTLLGMLRGEYAPSDDSISKSYLVWALAVTAWWIWPFIVWEGQTFHDRICACKVVTTLKADRPDEARIKQNRPRIYRRLAPIRRSRRRN
ncbi:RDD family protein [Rhizobium phaseoli]|uniref:RDD family protein n=1 Tax=Rhizobium phaseoli TaxID=396 RepID=UPI0007F16360|nr:RDD family protein [Rhizobium phaseoli]ANL34734.1 RDD domain-containing protein [Rhizobium phaseoli]ANL98456.1 RDD domain-containing protein [Rhizobium phaseoli]